MKITKRQLKKIIKEEVARVLSEGTDLADLRRAAQTVLSDLRNHVEATKIFSVGNGDGVALRDVIDSIAYFADPEYTDLAREQRGEIIAIINAIATDAIVDDDEPYIEVR